MRYAQDWRSLACVAVTLALLAAPHAWTLLGWMAAPWIVSSAFLCFVSSIVNHNHQHAPLFAARWANRLFDLALTLARGHTASGVIVPHNLNHHPLATRPDDWIRPELAGGGLGWLRLARYVVAASASMAVQRMRRVAPRLPRAMLPGVLLEKALLAAVIVAAFLHDWRIFLLFDALPWLAGLALLVGVNLLQHAGCDARMPLGESRNFTSPLGNWLLFNNGFHTAHHLEPHRHWCELPQLHLALRARLPRAGLEEPSILAYLWRFGWSRGAEGDRHA